MRLAKKCFCNFLFLALTITVFSACSGSGFAGAGLTPKQKNSVSEDANTGIDSIFETAKAVSVKEFSDLSFTRQQQVGMADYFELAVRSATNETIVIDGHVFMNIKDYLLEHEANWQPLTIEYTTVGEYLESMQVHSPADIKREDVSQGLAILEQLFTEDDTKSPGSNDIFDADINFGLVRQHQSYTHLALETDATNKHAAAALSGIADPNNSVSQAAIQNYNKVRERAGRCDTYPPPPGCPPADDPADIISGGFGPPGA